MQRWVAYNKEETEQESLELSAVKAQHELVKKQKTELEVARMKGEYVSAQEVDRLWTNVASVVRSRIINLPRKLAPSLVAIDDPDKIEEIIERDVRDALTMIANTPLPGEENYIPATDDEDQTE